MAQAFLCDQDWDMLGIKNSKFLSVNVHYFSQIYCQLIIVFVSNCHVSVVSFAINAHFEH